MATFQPRVSETVQIGFGFDRDVSEATVTRFEGRFLEVKLAKTAKPGEAARIMHQDVMAIGEVCGSRTGQSECYVTIEVQQFVSATSIGRYWRSAAPAPARNS
jgi:hypothetical protein